MKNRTICGLLLIVTGLCSCNNWLDVNPSSEIKGDKLFETETGFKDALIGIYIGMTDQKSYGANLSWGAIEFLGGQYHAPSGYYGQWQKCNYENANAQDIINDVWNTQYNLIANINLLLESLEQNGSVVNQTTYNVIKGEALALRAMLHFDLIRLFAKGNLANRENYLDEPCIPYVTKYSKEITAQKSYRETLELIHKDINEALQCLVSDPLYPYEVIRPDDYDDVLKDIFYSGTQAKKRETRFSWPATLLLQARIFHWEGNIKRAGECAEELITVCKKYVADGVKTWASESGNVTSTNPEAKDLVFYDELLFALDVTRLSTYLESAYSLTKNGEKNYDRLIQSIDFVHKLFDFETGEANSDLRYMHQYEKANDEEGLLTIKIQRTNKIYYSNVIPLMRMSEAYLIAAECLVQTDKAKAVKYMNFLKEKRRISDMYYLNESISEPDLQSAIIKEYRKEFTQEGQLFFCYKRMGLTTFPGIEVTGGTITDAQYQLPYPKVEQDMGQRK